MPSFNNVTIGDQYGSTPATGCIQFAYNPRGGWFVVGDQAGVIVQLQYLMRSGHGTRGVEEWAIDETELGPGATGTIPPDAIGIRFRNAQAGSNATVTAFIGTGDDPVLAIDSFGAPAPTGAVILGQGQTLGTHGTATVLTATSIPCEAVAVRADPSNSGIAYLGGAGVTTANGYELASNDAIGMDVNNPNAVFFDVDVTGEGVSWVAIG